MHPSFPWPSMCPSIHLSTHNSSGLELMMFPPRHTLPANTVPSVQLRMKLIAALYA